ncbi:glycosyltransferase WbuB [Rhodobacteraceae bacterium CH30]|nr:glycosyltransferase WbuB [Rhodobacteraceae bacterium CH30]
MRLALIIDDYLPHSTRVSPKMMHELAIELKRQGHEPFVLTPGVDGQQALLVEDRLDGVPIFRFRSGPLKDIPKVKRAINESLLSARAWRALAPTLRSRKIDGVVYYSPSIFFGSLVRRIKQLWGCPAYLILRDLFPQWVIDEGMIREGSPIARYFRYFEQKSYWAADHIGLMSQKNLDVFRQMNPHLSKTGILYNWASPAPAIAPTEQESLRTQLGLQDKVIYFYGGNIGHAQDMANLMRLAKGMQHHPDAHFLFIGQGDEYGLVESLIREHGLQNTTLLPSIPQEAFKKVLCEVDVGLFSLSRSHKAHNFPGKLLGYMVNGLPILGSVNPGNDLMAVINSAHAGIALENGKDMALLVSAERLMTEPTLRKRQGENARKLLHEKFSVESAACEIVNTLTTLHSADE